jgi:hypothetical protein
LIPIVFVFVLIVYSIYTHAQLALQHFCFFCCVLCIAVALCLFLNIVLSIVLHFVFFLDYSDLSLSFFTLQFVSTPLH